MFCKFEANISLLTILDTTYIVRIGLERTEPKDLYDFSALLENNLKLSSVGNRSQAIRHEIYKDCTNH